MIKNKYKSGDIVWINRGIYRGYPVRIIDSVCTGYYNVIIASKKYPMWRNESGLSKVLKPNSDMKRELLSELD